VDDRVVLYSLYLRTMCKTQIITNMLIMTDRGEVGEEASILPPIHVETDF
jgi:hypothetical protein